MIEKLHELIVLILSIPLIIYQFGLHIGESLLMTNGVIHNYFFMKRFGLIDDKMVDDFIEWKCEYIEKRGKDE